MIAAQLFLGNVFLRGELQKDAKNLDFKNFQSALYSKSGSVSFKYFQT